MNKIIKAKDAPLRHTDTAKELGVDFEISRYYDSYRNAYVYEGFAVDEDGEPLHDRVGMAFDANVFIDFTKTDPRAESAIISKALELVFDQVEDQRTRYGGGFREFELRCQGVPEEHLKLYFENPEPERE